MFFLVGLHILALNGSFACASQAWHPRINSGKYALELSGNPSKKRWLVWGGNQTQLQPTLVSLALVEYIRSKHLTLDKLERQVWSIAKKLKKSSIHWSTGVVLYDYDYTLLKTNSSHLKRCKIQKKVRIVFQPWIFRCYASFLESIYP